MKDYVTPEWEHILRSNNLDDFDALWGLQADWFEPPNQRRGGWSGVVRIELDLPDGTKGAIFLKRQENHTRRTLRHPVFGEPTFAGEITNILLLRQAGVPTMEPVYYGQRKIDGKWRAILVTRELVGYRPLHEVMREWSEAGWGHAVATRRRLIPILASVVRRMHKQRLVHNALHPKHVFVRLGDDLETEVALIDLEKMRQTVSMRLAARRDLDSLNRRARLWGSSDRLRFLKSYLGLRDLDTAGKNLWRYLAARKTRFMRKDSFNGG